MAWLLRGDQVLAAAEVAETPRARLRGLLGRDSFEGALVLRRVRQVHTFRMRFAIDVAFCDREGRVRHLTTLRPWRVSWPVWSAAFVVEAQAGAFARWGLQLGDVVRVSE